MVAPVIPPKASELVHKTDEYADVDKRNGRVDNKWCDKFNAWLEIWSLLEIKLGNRQFTWANNQADLIMSTIDRVFCCTDIDMLFFL